MSIFNFSLFFAKFKKLGAPALATLAIIILVHETLHISDLFFERWAWQKTDWAYTGDALLAEQPDHILIGSSKFYQGAYIPRLPPKTYILSLQFANSKLLEKIIRQHWDKILKAKSVQLELFPEMFVLNPFVSNQIERLEDLGVKTNILDRFLAAWDDRNISIFLPSVFKFRLTPQEYFSFKEHAGENSLSDFEINNKKHGYYKNLSVMRAKDFSKNSSDSLKFIRQHYSLDQKEPHIESWIATLSDLQKNGVRLRLVIMPTQIEFRKLQSAQWPDFYRVTLPLLKSKFEVDDFSDHPCGDTKLFPQNMSDSAHFNEKGAICFAPQLSSWMKADIK